jgi:thiol-disulfide isomerase/thioredoxin
MKRAILWLAAMALIAQPKAAPVDEAAFPKLVAAHKGKVVLVSFWATWCVPCRKEMPELVKLEEKLRARGLDVVTISADLPEREAAALKVFGENHVSGPAYLKKAADDDKFYDSIDPQWGGVLPALFLYDRSGKKVRSFIGETPINVIEAAVDKVL